MTGKFWTHCWCSQCHSDESPGACGPHCAVLVVCENTCKGHPGHGLTCSLAPHHAGRHKAYSQHQHEKGKLLGSWRNQAMCAEKGVDEEGNPWYCSLEKHHVGKHSALLNHDVDDGVAFEWLAPDAHDYDTHGVYPTKSCWWAAPRPVSVALKHPAVMTGRFETEEMALMCAHRLTIYSGLLSQAYRNGFRAVCLERVIYEPGKVVDIYVNGAYHLVPHSCGGQHYDNVLHKGHLLHPFTGMCICHDPRCVICPIVAERVEWKAQFGIPPGLII